MLSGRLGPYTLLRQIAVGGMAEIYLAALGDEPDARRVAIKVIHPQNATDPDFVRMLLDEAKLAVQLDHPNIIRTYDLGRETDEYYIVMEFLDGADLFKVQQRAAIKRLAFPIALGVYVTREITRALHFVHRLKDASGRALHVVHRDISPQNVLISFEGDVKLTDFGIAKVAHRAEQTQIGIIKGKYYYMSPEQAAGRFVDGRTDLFAAGILLYEMLVGEMLYYDDNLDKLLAMVRRADISPPSKRRRDIPPALEAIVMKALRKRPDERFQTAEEYGQALDAFMREFAPDYSADDVGIFAMRVMDAPRNRTRRGQAPTLQIAPVLDDDESPTVGLTNDQVDGLGIRDENSLIYQPAEKLQALLQGVEQAARDRAEQSGLLYSRAVDAAKPKSQQGLLHKKTEVDPELLEHTYPDSDPSGFFDDSEGKSSDEFAPQLSPKRKGPLRSDVLRTPRRHFVPPTSGQIGSASDEAHELPTVSHDVVAPVHAIRAIPVGSVADEQHDSPTAPRPIETAALARVSMQLPAIDMQSAQAHYLAASADILTDDFNDQDRPLVFESAPPEPSASSFEMILSDDNYARLQQIALPDEPAPPAPKRNPKSKPPKPVAPSLNRVAFHAAEHSQRQRPKALAHGTPLQDPGHASAFLSKADSLTSVPPVTGGSRGRFLYAVAGLGATLISAILTWQITIGQHRQTQPNAHGAESLDGAAAVRKAGPSLQVFDVPDVEPSPAVPAALAAPPASSYALTPAKSDTGFESAARARRGQVQFSTTPAGAEVYVNKLLVGTTPFMLGDLPLDKDIKYELRLAGFKKFRKRLKWKGATSLVVDIKLRSTGRDRSSDEEDTAAPISAPSPAPTAAPNSALSEGRPAENSQPAEPAKSADKDAAAKSEPPKDAPPAPIKDTSPVKDPPPVKDSAQAPGPAPVKDPPPAEN